MNEIISFEIPGEPRTKKNSQRIFLRGNKRFIAPSEAYKEYEEYAGYFAPRLDITQPINLKVLYYMGTRRRVDLCNLLEATCDILTRAGTIRDDSSNIVKGHDGSRVLYDKKRPRCEVIIEEWIE